MCPMGVVHFEYFRADAFGIFKLVSCVRFRNSYVGYTVPVNRCLYRAVVEQDGCSAAALRNQVIRWSGDSENEYVFFRSTVLYCTYISWVTCYLQAPACCSKTIGMRRPACVAGRFWHAYACVCRWRVTYEMYCITYVCTVLYECFLYILRFSTTHSFVAYQTFSSCSYDS